MYEKEAEEMDVKLAKMKADGKDDYDIKKQVCHPLYYLMKCHQARILFFVAISSTFYIKKYYNKDSFQDSFIKIVACLLIEAAIKVKVYFLLQLFGSVTLTREIISKEFVDKTDALFDYLLRANNVRYVQNKPFGLPMV